jgi:preprotein translocase subunit SecE
MLSVEYAIMARREGDMTLLIVLCVVIVAIIFYCGRDYI